MENVEVEEIWQKRCRNLVKENLSLVLETNSDGSEFHGRFFRVPAVPEDPEEEPAAKVEIGLINFNESQSIAFYPGVSHTVQEKIICMTLIQKALTLEF